MDTNSEFYDGGMWIVTDEGKTLPARTVHRALWNWLAKTGNDSKWDWPGWQANGGNIPLLHKLCVGCQIISWNDSEGLCPVFGRWCFLDDGCHRLFHCWFRATTIESRKRMARMIRDRWMEA